MLLWFPKIQRECAWTSWGCSFPGQSRECEKVILGHLRVCWYCRHPLDAYGFDLHSWAEWLQYGLLWFRMVALLWRMTDGLLVCKGTDALLGEVGLSLPQGAGSSVGSLLGDARGIFSLELRVDFCSVPFKREIGAGAEGSLDSAEIIDLDGGSTGDAVMGDQGAKKEHVVVE
ncbi:hypothetical protein VNO78_27870 [Psophocarpus tetragonolobus]|uniref:Uncharacterized protein n=1 Tax=Psophocarpus tetragonolobus TaxID=3891 RepID=A0AAN9S234_PSOTE